MPRQTLSWSKFSPTNEKARPARGIDGTGLATRTAGVWSDRALSRPDPLPPRLLYAEPLRRRMRVLFAETWIAQSDDVVLLHEPGRYPVAYFAKSDIGRDALTLTGRTTDHCDLGVTAWYAVEVGERRAARGAWENTALPESRRSWRTALPSPGGRRTPSTKKMSGFSVTPSETLESFGELIALGAAVVLLADAVDPELYLVPSEAWLDASPPLKNRDNVGKGSEPEFGISLARSSLPALARFAWNSSSATSHFA